MKPFILDPLTSDTLQFPGVGPGDEDQAGLQCLIIRLEIRVDQFVLFRGRKGINSLLDDAAYSLPLDFLVLVRVLCHVRVNMLEVIINVVFSVVAQVV